MNSSVDAIDEVDIEMKQSPKINESFKGNRESLLAPVGKSKVTSVKIKTC